MRRESSVPREGYIEKIERLGFVFHTLEGKPYWNEAAAYVLEPREVDVLEAAGNELHGMCLAAVQHVLATGSLDRLGIPKAAHETILQAWESAAPSIYGRFDLAFDGENPPKLLEYNADTPTSLLEAAVIQWHWQQEVHPEADQFNSIWEALIEKWQTLKASGMDRVHFACMDAMEDVMTTAVLMDTASEAGVGVSLMRMRDIGWDSVSHRFVDPNLEPIQTLFKLYPWEWMLRDRFSGHGLATYGSPQWIEPIWKMVLSNKAILAILWELYPEHPNLLPAFLDGPRGMSKYVRKPLLGREGANVTVVRGGETTQVDGPYDDGGYVYQAYAPLPVYEGNHVVVGAWVIDGRARGIGIRESDGPITEDDARFVPHYFQPRKRLYDEVNEMNARTVTLAPIPVVMYRHTGPYEGLSPSFDRLWEWVEAHGVPASRTIGIYWDNPDYVPAPRLRSAACVEVPPYYRLLDRGGLPLTLEQIAGGDYMTTTFIGPYEDLAPVWTQLTHYIENRMGLRISQNPAFEVYVNDASKTPPDQLITELYMPLA